MTASGLPLSLEKCLGSLFQVNTLSSWRIFASDCGEHVVTIKLRPREDTQHGEQHTAMTDGWVRKGQSRAKRDRQRWIDHQEKLENTKSVQHFETKGLVPVASRGATGMGDRSDNVCGKVCTEDDVMLTEKEAARTTVEDISVTSLEASKNICTSDKHGQLFSNDTGLSEVFKVKDNGLSIEGRGERPEGRE